ncbi:hypothetical protein [Paracoccus sp. AK26]|uniref:hypothetical protein n=1 Tax=Paracoccus sp. AK26 TaxID=2589076 RepID=UPI001431E771|nr:hypothetical protein [Paracoccus sp. AK26]
MLIGKGGLRFSIWHSGSSWDGAENRKHSCAARSTETEQEDSDFLSWLIVVEDHQPTPLPDRKGDAFGPPDQAIGAASKSGN